jgi:hypothetical protein
MRGPWDYDLAGFDGPGDLRVPESGYDYFDWDRLIDTFEASVELQPDMTPDAEYRLCLLCDRPLDSYVSDDICPRCAVSQGPPAPTGGGPSIRGKATVGRGDEGYSASPTPRPTSNS